MRVIVNVITFYRIVTAPLLLYLILAGHLHLFKWLLAASFITEAIDGPIARKFKVTNPTGARLDSLGDDLTVGVAVIGVAVTRTEFVTAQWPVIVVMLALFLTQLVLAMRKYSRMTSFHTYCAKVAAMLQALFLLSAFFFGEVSFGLFYIACAVTLLDIIEEIALVILLPRWKADVKGIYWVIKQSRHGDSL